MSLYGRAQIERLMPCLWDEGLAINGIPNEYAPPADMPKGPAPDPSHAGSHIVHVADLQVAWAGCGLSQGQRQVLFLRFGLDSLLDEIAGDLDINNSTVRRRLDSGIGKIGTFLNGRPFTDENQEDDKNDIAA